MELSPKHMAAGVVLAAAIGAAPATLTNKLDDTPRVRAAIHADGCFTAAQELRDFCATNPEMRDCPTAATWLDARCKERAKRD